MEQHSGNLSELAGRVIAVNPHLPGQEAAFVSFCRTLSRRMRRVDESRRLHVLEQAREEVKGDGGTLNEHELALRFACSVIVDVAAQGWGITVRRSQVELRSPEIEGVPPDELKRRIRTGHLLERDAQLSEGSVREFVQNMEKRKLGSHGWVSVFSLMRDGRDLANALSNIVREPDSQRRLGQLNSAVSPYLQVVTPDATCSHTGLKLMDIWRYFRHTWVSTYKSLPGRSMMILVRDSAAANHPVIGIAALGSSMAQQTLRDRWIGWDSEVFDEEIMTKPTKKLAKWTVDSTKRLIASIYVADLLDEGIIERHEITNPTDVAIQRLLRDAEKAADAHRKFPSAAEHKSNGNQSDWKRQALTPLFRSKRARMLALVLGIRATLKNVGMRDATKEALKNAVANPKGRHAIRQLVRLVKAEHVGVDMMDIVICGAVAPYNYLLGGKLVCSLLMSPEVVKFYKQRYDDKHSIIASSMKGRAVKRAPNLVLLATTSLYGVGSSQYNRVKIPLEALGGVPGSRIEYVDLGKSKGYGSYHFSQATIDYLETMLGRAGDGRKVNSIFGEGVNPLMRKLREGLGKVGLPTDELLRHGNPRVVYGVALAHNFREVLLGLAKRPNYFLRVTKPEAETQKLAEFWRKRWLAGRILQPGILEEVERHSLSYPITHGARVKLPNLAEADIFE